MFPFHARLWPRAFALGAALACAPPALAQYQFTPVDPPGSIASEALGVNDAGIVVGVYNDASGTAFGFVDDHGTYTQLAPTPAAGCGYFAGICNTAWGVNNAGTVSGSYYTSTGPGPDDATEHGFIYSSGSFTQLNLPGAAQTAVYGLSNAGVAVGQAIDSLGNQVAFIYTVSTGQYTTFTLPGLPSGASFLPFAINDSGEIVGTYTAPGLGAVSTFLYTLGSSSYTLLPQDPDAVVGSLEGTFGSGINDAGDVTGSYTVADGFLPYLYHDGTYENFSVGLPSYPGIDNSGGDGVNNVGDIAGFYSRLPDGNLAAFLAAPAPEPSTWAMILIGLAGLGAATRRRRVAVPRAA